MSEELEARVAALEARCAELEGIAQRALGEAMFAGLFAPNVIISQARAGTLNIEAIRMVIDQTSLICEREGSAFLR